jgi:hypothetical protein
VTILRGFSIAFSSPICAKRENPEVATGGALSLVRAPPSSGDGGLRPDRGSYKPNICSEHTNGAYKRLLTRRSRSKPPRSAALAGTRRTTRTRTGRSCRPHPRDGEEFSEVDIAAEFLYSCPDLGIVPIVHRHEVLPWRKPFERLPLALDSLVIYCHYLVLGTYAPPAERSNRTKRGN